MDCYMGNGIDDFVVPRDQELPDGFSSTPDFWSKWGSDKCFDMDNSLMMEDFKINGLCSQEMEICVNDYKANCGSSEDSLQRSAVSSEQLDHFAGIEQLDDLFLDSLLEDLPRNEDVPKSFCFSPESQCFLLSAGDSDISDSQSNMSCKGSSKYLQKHAFSPSVALENREVADSLFSHCNLQHRDLPVKAPLVKAPVPSEQNVANGYISKDPSIEESVLQDLKMVMSQLSDETRICFRDAFYRLAKNSKHHAKPQSHKGNFSAAASIGTDHDINNRSRISKPMESETNIYDRAIANLVYDKMDSNVTGFPPASAMYPPRPQVTESSNNSSSHQEIQWLCHCMLSGDAEVPRLGKQHSEIAANPNQGYVVAGNGL